MTKRHCTEWSVYAIKVSRERWEPMDPMLSNVFDGTSMWYSDHSAPRRLKSKGAFTPDMNEANKSRERLSIFCLLASFAREIHYTTVLHCCFGFSASARNHVTARAISWLVNAARISGKVQNSFTSFTRIASQYCLSRLCIDLTCKSFTRNALFASGVNAPWLSYRLKKHTHNKPHLPHKPHPSQTPSTNHAYH